MSANQSNQINFDSNLDNIEENLIKTVHKLKGCEPEEDKDDENLLSEIEFYANSVLNNPYLSLRDLRSSNIFQNYSKQRSNEKEIQKEKFCFLFLIAAIERLGVLFSFISDKIKAINETTLEDSQLLKEIATILSFHKDSKPQSQSVLMNEKIIIGAMDYSVSLNNSFAFTYFLRSSKINFYSVYVGVPTIARVLIEYGDMKESNKLQGVDSNEIAVDKLNSLLQHEVLIQFDQSNEELMYTLKHNRVKPKVFPIQNNNSIIEKIDAKDQVAVDFANKQDLNGKTRNNGEPEESEERMISKINEFHK